jgi:hypothetical protein
VVFFVADFLGEFKSYKLKKKKFLKVNLYKKAG